MNSNRDESPAIEPELVEAETPVVRSRFSVLHHLKTVWHPVPLAPPRIDKQLMMSSSTFDRIAATLQDIVLSVEYWISPGGSLRQWFRINLTIGVILLITLVFILPLLLVLSAIVTGTGMIAAIMGNILTTLTCLLGILVVGIIIVAISTALWLFFKSRTAKRIYGMEDTKRF